MTPHATASQRAALRAAPTPQLRSSFRAAAPPVRSPAQQQRQRRQPRGRLTTAALSSDSDPGGDKRIQEGLVDMVNLQVGQQHVKDFFLDESEKLRQTAEEAKAEVDQLHQLELDRSSLAFGSAMADINQSADEFEAQLLAQRLENEADAAALVDWQRQMAIDRSRGHFFKSLYQAELKEEEADALACSPRRKALSERVLAPDTGVNSGSRAQLLAAAFLAGVLVTAIGADVAGPAPAWGQDLLYAVMAAVLGAVAWGSRDAL